MVIILSGVLWVGLPALFWLDLSHGRDDSGDVLSHEMLYKLAESPDFCG